MTYINLNDVDLTTDLLNLIIYIQILAYSKNYFK